MLLPQEELALDVMDDLLLGTPVSPLYKKLRESGLGESVISDGLETVLQQEQAFDVEDLVLLRDGGMLEVVFAKYVTRRKVEAALDRRELLAGRVQAEVSGQRAGSHPVIEEEPLWLAEAAFPRGALAFRWCGGAGGARRRLLAPDWAAPAV